MRFFATLLHFLHALRIRMLNAMSISEYGNTLYHLYKLQINANAFTDLHCGYAIRISVYGNVHLLSMVWKVPLNTKKKNIYIYIYISCSVYPTVQVKDGLQWILKTVEPIG